MRILFVNPYYKPYLGGIERIIEHLGERLLASDHVEAVGVLTTRVAFGVGRMRDLPSHEFIDGLEVFRCTFRPSIVPPLFHAWRAGYVSRDIDSVIERFRPDVIHFTYSEWWAANLGIYLATRTTPHVLSTFFHDLPYGLRTAPLFYVNRWLVQRIDAVHVLTDKESDQVRDAYDPPEHRTVVIPPGVNLSTLPRRTDSRVPVTVLAVGRLSHHKGQLSLVRMFHSILTRHASIDARLVLVGDRSDGFAQITQYVEQHQLGSRVDIHGHCSDERLAELYGQADIFALPTRYESFGLVFIEAMGHGLPVVTYGVGPVPSILTAGASLACPDDEDDFRSRLEGLLLDPAARQQLGQAGRALVEESYSWQAMTDQFVQLYSRVLKRGAA